MAKQTKSKSEPADAGTTTAAKTLYDISREFSALEELLQGIDGDVTPEQQAQLDEFLKGLEKDRDAKIDGYCGLIRDLEARRAARKAEAERFAKLAKFDENKVKRLKWVLLNFFRLHNVERVETVRFRLRRASNASAPVIVGERFLNFPEELPERFRTVEFVPNLKEIKKALDDGETLDFASFGEKGENLRIE